MANNPAMADNAGRVTHEALIDAALADWCAGLPAQEVIAILEENRVPVGPIYDVEDMLAERGVSRRSFLKFASYTASIHFMLAMASAPPVTKTSDSGMVSNVSVRSS